MRAPGARGRGQFFAIAAFFFFGLVLPWHAWFAGLGWRLPLLGAPEPLGIAFALILTLNFNLRAAAALLFGRRPPVLLLVKPGLELGVSEAGLRLHAGALWPAVSWSVFVSVFVFGATSVPATQLYRISRAESADAAGASERPDTELAAGAPGSSAAGGAGGGSRSRSGCDGEAT
eukprot:tig00000145_g8862.t1